MIYIYRYVYKDRPHSAANWNNENVSYMLSFDEHLPKKSYNVNVF